MKKFAALSLLALAGVAHADTYTSSARVIATEPRYIQTQQQACDPVTVTSAPAPAQDNSTGGAIVGGLVGGLLGHQVGGGSGQTAATIAGAVGGAMLGSHLGSNTGAGAAPTTTTQANCRYVPATIQDGTTLTLDIGGHRFTRFLPAGQMPPRVGEIVPVTVTVQ